MPPPMHSSYPPNASYAEANDKYAMGFSDKAIRAGFVRKVVTDCLLSFLIYWDSVMILDLVIENKEGSRGTEGNWTISR